MGTDLGWPHLNRQLTPRTLAHLSSDLGIWTDDLRDSNCQNLEDGMGEPDGDRDPRDVVRPFARMTVLGAHEPIGLG